MTVRSRRRELDGSSAARDRRSAHAFCAAHPGLARRCRRTRIAPLQPPTGPALRMNDASADTAPATSQALRQRMAMGTDNALKIGLFGSNCSSGRAVTLVPERWTGNWEDNLALAKLADERGIEFMLPVGRWKG